jgi:hypothetical protein
MKRKPTIDLGIKAVSGFGALTHYDEIWLVDRRNYITECGVLMSDGEIWLVDSHDRTTALVIADCKEAPDSEFSKDEIMRRLFLCPWMLNDCPAMSNRIAVRQRHR